MNYHDIIVIGSSAGGIGIMQELVKQFRKDSPASIFWVQHLAPQSTTKIILESIQNKTEITCRIPEHEEPIQMGCLYMAPSNHHMMLRDDKILIKKGPKESRSRPSIDTLFRSAAASYGPRVIGVVLSGLLDDGVVGMEAIKRSGGRTIVQEIIDAPYPQLPQCVLDNVNVDYVVPITEMGYILDGLVHQPVEEGFEIPSDIKLEADISERLVTEIDTWEKFGHQVPYECPSCGGALRESEKGKYSHLRCYTGHTFTYPSLYHEKTKKLEEALYVALRLLEERKKMSQRMAKMEKLNEKNFSAKILDEKTLQLQEHIECLRKVLLSDF